MFEVISSIIAKIIEKISSTVIELKKDDIIHNQRMFTKIFEFHKAVLEYENAINRSIDYAEKIHSGKIVLLKSKVEEMIAPVIKSHNNFLKELNGVQNIFAIYIPELHIELRELIKRGKGTGKIFGKIYEYTKTIELVPSQELSQRGGLTYLVKYPSKIPSSEEIKLLKENYEAKMESLKHNEKALKEIEKEIISSLENICEMKKVNFEDDNSLKMIVDEGRENLKLLTSARITLGEYIRANFPMNMIT